METVSESRAEQRQVGGYRLLERLGEGGMGVVHRALDPQGRPVAIKLMRPHIAHDADARRRLAREVDILARVRDERVAAVLDADTDGDAPYVVTEFVPGVPLDDLIEDQGPLDMRGLVTLGEGLAEALTAIHRAGIVHRDLKPGNVMMVRDRPVVIDFGIAQVADDVRLTMTGMVMGTPGYLSPELVEGGEVTEATDWWGWAACLAFAASGNPPFGRGPMAVVLDRVTRGRPDLNGVDERLRPLLEAALATDARQRPEAGVVIDALRAYAGDRPVTEVLQARRPAPPVAGPGFQQPPSGASAAAGPSATRPTPTRDAAVSEAATGAGGVSAVGRWPGGPQEELQVPQTRAMPQQRTRQQPLQAQPAQQQPPRPQQYPPPQRHDSYPAPQSGAAGPVGSPPQGWAGGDQHGPGGYGRPASAPAYPDAYAQPQAHGSPDPRVGRPMRSGVLAVGLVAFVALVSAMPYVGLGAYLVWSVLARTVDRSMSARVVRRHTNGGERRTDTAVSVAASPWHLFLGAVQAVLALLLPLGVGLVSAAAAGYALSGSGAGGAVWSLAGVVALGALLLALMSWWGPGGTGLRRGSRSLVRALTPSEVGARIVAAVLVALALVAVVITATSGAGPDWWPALGPPWPDLGWWEALLP